MFSAAPWKSSRCEAGTKDFYEWNYFRISTGDAMFKVQPLFGTSWLNKPTGNWGGPDCTFFLKHGLTPLSDAFFKADHDELIEIYIL